MGYQAVGLLVCTWFSESAEISQRQHDVQMWRTSEVRAPKIQEVQRELNTLSVGTLLCGVKRVFDMSLCKI
jgi:hypothetical protein